jgi:hypothetical protein
MQLIQTKQVKVGDMTFPIKVTNRAMIEYEAMTGSSSTTFKGTEKLVQFFYVTAKAGAKSDKLPFPYSFDEFLDIIDDFYSDTILNFTAAIAEEKPEADNKKKQKKSI